MGAPASQQITTETDPWVRAQTQGLMGDAYQYLQKTPYNPYPGQTYAGAQPFHNAAARYLSEGLLGQGLGFETPQTYGPFSYDPNLWQFTPTDVDTGTGGVGDQPPMGGGPGSSGDGTPWWEPPGSLPGDQNNPMFRDDPAAAGGIADYYAGGPGGKGAGGNYALAVDGGFDPGPGYGGNTDPNAPTNPWTGGIYPVRPPTPGEGGGYYGGGHGTMSGRDEGLAASRGARDVMDFRITNPYEQVVQRDAEGNPMLDEQGNPITMSAIDQYMNPYEDDVIGGMQDDMLQAEQMARAAGLHSLGSSAYGGDRTAIVADEENKNFYDRMAKASNQARREGFTTALSAAQRGVDQSLANQDLSRMAAGDLSRIGTQNLQNLFSGANALMGMGNFGQNNAQNMINADIARYDQARNDPMRRFGLLQSILTGMPLNSTQTTTFNPNMASQIGGGLMGLLGGLGAGGAFNNLFGGGGD